MNYTKTEVLRIVAIENTAKMIETNEQLKRKNGCVEIGGITASTTMNEMIGLDTDPLMEKIIKTWSSRNPILYGKVYMINTVISSQLIYRLPVLPTHSWT